jgi:hypothetical protein
MAKLPPRLRGKSTKARLGRLNRRIKGVKKRYNEGGGVSPSGRPPGLDKLTARRKVLQNKFSDEQKAKSNKKTWNTLSDPTATLSGKPLMRSARALEKLTSRPGIDAKRTEIKLNRAATDRDVTKLGNMGGRLKTQLDGLSTTMDQYGKEAYTRAQDSNAEMNQRLTASADEAKNRLNSLQGSVLGEQISNLTGQGVSASGSGSGQVMGQFAQMQQQSQANRTQATADLAAKMAQANLMTTEAGTTAAKNTLNNQAISVQRNIATRSADRMFEGSQNEARAQAELATLKGLRGAELVNQIMKLRGTEREFISEKERNATERFIANTQARNNARELAIKQYGEETDRYSALNDDSSGGGSGGSGGGGGGDDNDARLNRSEFKQGLAAAEEYRKSGKMSNGKVTDWREFLNEVESAEGLSWTPRERAQFKRRYKKYLTRKG